MNTVQNPPNNIRDVLARWGHPWYTAYYNGTYWRIYTPIGSVLANTSPDEWRELPDAAVAVATPEAASGTDLAARMAAHDAELAQLNELIARLNQRITALEGAAATAQPDDEEPTVREMIATLNYWQHNTPMMRQVYFDFGFWYLLDPEARFAACGPESGDEATRAAYRALQKGGQQ